jgi:predicted amidohydrolase YtcJ
MSFAWHDLLARGAILALGSDWPVMAANPLAGLAVAVTRASAQGLPPGGFNAHQAIRMDEAVRAYTWGSAFAVHRERDLGRIEVGALADLVILEPAVRIDRPRTLFTGRVRLVVVDGACRFDRRALDPRRPACYGGPGRIGPARTGPPRR